MHHCFEAVPDPVKARRITLPEYLMSALAIFVLRIQSLLAFDQRVRLGAAQLWAENVHSLHGVTAVPSDTAMRARLDATRLSGAALRRCSGVWFTRAERCAAGKT